MASTQRGVGVEREPRHGHSGVRRQAAATVLSDVEEVGLEREPIASDGEPHEPRDAGDPGRVGG